MQRQDDYKPYPELKLALTLSQMQGHIKFLEHMNTGKTVTGDDLPRNTTERSTVKNLLGKIELAQDLYKTVCQEKTVSAQTLTTQQLADQQFLHDS